MIKPIDAPPTAIAAHTANAFARSRPSVNVVAMIDSAIGEINAAPKPWTPRNKISIPAVVPQGVHQRDASVKIATPIRNRRLRPNRSPGPAPQQQKTAEHQRVGVHHPLQAVDGEVQVVLDRRQGDVHDGRVEHDHELGHADQHQDNPPVRVALTRVGDAHRGR